MLKSIIGTKIGMTQVFDETGNMIPVTVVSAGPCFVVNIRTKEKDGYTAVQVAYGDLKEKAVKKPVLGQFKKINLSPKKYIHEFRSDESSEYKPGQEIKVDIFQAGDYVDVSGLSKGKGFAGAMKRHNFSGGPVSHGQSDRQRAPGSSGTQGHQRVIKGTKKPGHMGHEYVKIQRLLIVGVDTANNLLLINGALPGSNQGIVFVEKTVKKIKVHHQQDIKKKQAVKGKK